MTVVRSPFRCFLETVAMSKTYQNFFMYSLNNQIEFLNLDYKIQPTYLASNFKDDDSSYRLIFLLRQLTKITQLKEHLKISKIEQCGRKIF